MGGEDTAAGERPVKVAIGLIARSGSYLIRKRPSLPGSPMPGVWEFPGGKCEVDETVESAVCRECLEETGLAVRILRLRHSRRHRYSHGFVELYFFDCETVRPADEALAGSGFVWVEAGLLRTLEFPDANEPVLRELAAEACGRAGSATDR